MTDSDCQTREAESCWKPDCDGTRREHSGSGVIEDCTGSCGYTVTSDTPFHVF